MRPTQALAEDLRRFGLVLLAAGVVGGFLRDQVHLGAAIYTMVIGVALNILGYWLHSRRDKT